MIGKLGYGLCSEIIADRRASLDDTIASLLKIDMPEKMPARDGALVAARMIDEKYLSGR